LEEEVTTIKRRIQIEGNLYFEYEVSPHRAILARRSEVETNDLSGATISCQSSNVFPSQNSNNKAQLDRTKRVTSLHIPFKQVRLKGQINPLKPPLHVETVLIGRALGQQTGYLAGVVLEFEMMATSKVNLSMELKNFSPSETLRKR
jgi:hypothetical protein